VAHQVAIGVTILRIIVGIWLLLQGVSLLSLSRINKGSGKWLIGGFFAMILALLILFNPALGFLTIVLWTAIALIRIFNVLLEFS